ncbi:DNA-binding protein SMUBP-2 [Dichanthelium oligosanthes]|uniref:DNA-binding protein SMUBP-2 n=1 Tax=Dichanthelium oligosanthes TaxID=888268 RepID=A0A1E5V440_9POAL|nr:DNA-binding protein SMUBP-2 [Dichanthelium oligosanthes]
MESVHLSTEHASHDDSGIRNKERRRRWRKRKQTAKEEGARVPSEEELSIRTVKLYQSGDPIGQKELGRHVAQWLKQGMHLMASKFASSEIQDDGAALWLDGGSSDGHMGFVMQAQPYLSATPMPKGQESLCFKASTHYPTLFDNFQRELRDVLLQQQNEGLITDWRSTQSWMLLKEFAKSAEHRAAARRSRNPAVHNTLGISLDKTRLMQTKIDDFVKKMTDLLHLERDAELEFTQAELNATSMMDGKSEKLVQPVEYLVSHNQDQEQCDTICNLKVISSSIGLTGLHLVLFRVEGRHKLPPTRLSPGDMVCVRTCNSQGEVATSCMQGFVHNLGDDDCSITVALKSRRGDPTFSKFFGKSVRIDRIQALADALTYERNCEALMLLQKRGLEKRNACIGVVATLFGDKEDVMKLEQNNLIDWGGSEVCDEALLERHTYNFDTSQSKALALALNKKRPVLVIQGPPGTGKTGLLSYLIACVVRRGERVLITAPSNAAIDNMVEKLSGTGLNIVRVGNPSRISPSVASRSLGEIVTRRLEKFTEEFERKKSDLRKDLKHCIQVDSLASGIRQLLKRLGKDYKKKEKETIREVMSNAEVVLSTNIGAADPLIRGIGSFDLVIIDEAGQAIEPSCWIPILQGKRCILAGDHRQLAPVVLSREAMEGGLGMSLLERASSLHDELLTTTLTMQYRMHDAIASWASNEMYGGLLKSSPSVASRLLVDYPFIKATWMTQCALLLLDTRMPYGSLNIDCEESLDPAGTGSFYNNGEADIVVQHVLSLVQCGVPPTSIAVQSPYIAQVQLLRDRLEEYPLASGVEVSTIDSFQGREADAVFISMVRSNSLAAVGFLGDSRRMNVAITRARSLVAVVCDSSTIGNNAFLARLLRHIRQHGQVRHVEPGFLDGGSGLGFNPPALPSLGGSGSLSF